MKQFMKKAQVAYQLYSAREHASRDLPGLMKSLKEIGYAGVEFAGFHGHDAGSVRHMLADTGLIAVSSHVPLKQLEENLSSVLSFHREIGCGYIALPWLEEGLRPGQLGFPGVIRSLFSIGNLCLDEGMPLLYHHHDFEFVHLSGMPALDFLLAALPPSLLGAEIDVAWVKFAGLDPVDYLLKHRGRVPLVHLKDYAMTGGKASYDLQAMLSEPESIRWRHVEFRPFGQGCLNADAIVRAGLEAGARWFIIEQDSSVGRSPLEAAEISLEPLRRIGVL